MATAEWPLVYIVVLNWNGWRDTLECIESLRSLTYPNYRIVIVDNGSANDSEARIRAAHPDIPFLQTGRNLGFAGGNNVGIRYALERDADYLWLFNNDALARPDALTALVERAESDPRIGFVGSKVLFASRPDLVWFAGGTINPETGRGEHIPNTAPDDERLPPAHEPSNLTGCSLLARREVVERVGPLPDLYFLYYEEVDWQYTARGRGWKALYEPASVALHKVSVSAGIDSPLAAFHAARSRLIFVRRHMPRARKGAIIDLMRQDAKRQLKARRVKAALATGRGILSGLVAPTTWRPPDGPWPVSAASRPRIPAPGRARRGG